MREHQCSEPTFLHLRIDAAQKVPGWADLVKLLWDEDTASGAKLRVFLLGSSPLLVGRGLSESLAGRFETIRVTHWSFPEMRDAFGWDLDRYLYFGGYPGAAPLVRDEERWRSYILNSLAHYLGLLAGAGMVTGLPKYTGSQIRARGSSPKLVCLNTALISAQSGRSYREALADRDWWGRLVETAVGAHLLNNGTETLYWRESNREVDYVAREGHKLAALEVASGARKGALPGIAQFAARYPNARPLLVGGQGIPLVEFLSSPPSRWLA